jgi:hypothetical protein
MQPPPRPRHTAGSPGASDRGYSPAPLPHRPAAATATARTAPCTDAIAASSDRAESPAPATHGRRGCAPRHRLDLSIARRAPLARVRPLHRRRGARPGVYLLAYDTNATGSLAWASAGRGLAFICWPMTRTRQARSRGPRRREACRLRAHMRRFRARARCEERVPRADPHEAAAIHDRRVPEAHRASSGGLLGVADAQPAAPRAIPSAVVTVPAKRNAVCRSDDSRSNGSSADTASRGITTSYQRSAALAAV